MTLLNDGAVRTPHLLSCTRENGRQVPYRQPEHVQIGDPNSGFWKITKDGMYGVANRPNGTARKSFADAPYKVAAKSGTAQVYGLKANETYNTHKIAQRLRDHKLMRPPSPPMINRRWVWWFFWKMAASDRQWERLPARFWIISFWAITLLIYPRSRPHRPAARVINPS